MIPFMSTELDSMVEINGKLVDEYTRCIHYYSNLDIIAIKFYCCSKYYPCYQCHDECEKHAPLVWPISKQFTETVIICGICKLEMTVDEYLNCNSCCYSCKSLFNPKCKLHYSLYFETKTP